jgi:hypothetical protein
MGDEREFDAMATYLKRVPGIAGAMGKGRADGI